MKDSGFNIHGNRRVLANEAVVVADGTSGSSKRARGQNSERTGQTEHDDPPAVFNSVFSAQIAENMLGELEIYDFQEYLGLNDYVKLKKKLLCLNISFCNSFKFCDVRPGMFEEFHIRSSEVKKLKALAIRII
jgi:hypothetical protein